MLAPLKEKGTDDAGTGRMLMSPHDGGVDRGVPIDLACRVGRGLDLVEQTFPRSVGRPQPVAFIDGLPRTELDRPQKCA